jgi:putative holliday junction resolvase
MALLGLDYGERRIGVAVSDALFITAQSAGYIDCQKTPDIIAEIKNLIEKRGIDKIVVGLPIRLDGKDTAQTEKTRNFIEELKQELDVAIDSFDERLTSKAAERTLISAGMRRNKRKQKIDAMAAQMMLQTYMRAKGL